MKTMFSLTDMGTMSVDQPGRAAAEVLMSAPGLTVISGFGGENRLTIHILPRQDRQSSVMVVSSMCDDLVTCVFHKLLPTNDLSELIECLNSQWE